MKCNYKRSYGEALNRKWEQQKKVNKAQRKYEKETIKDIKNKILNTIETGKNYTYYASNRLNDNIITYFEAFGIEFGEDDTVCIKISW